MPNKRPTQTEFGVPHPRNYGSGQVRLARKYVDRYTKLRCIEQLHIRFVDEDLLTNHPLGDQLRPIVGIPEWRAVLMDIGEYEVYPDLVQEFLATLKIGPFDKSSTKCMKFSVLRHEAHLSCDDLSRILGLDDLQEGVLDRKAGMTAQETNDFWATVRSPACTDAFWPGRNTRAQLDSPLHRLLMYILGHNVQAKVHGVNKLTLDNMFCLYSLVHRVRIHMGVVLMNFFDSQTIEGVEDKLAGIYIGPYVTWLFLRIWGNEFQNKLSARNVGYMPCEALRPRRILWTAAYTALEAQGRARNRNVPEAAQQGDEGDDEEIEEDEEMPQMDEGPSEPVAESSRAGRKRSQRPQASGVRAPRSRASRAAHSEESPYGEALQQIQTDLSTLQLDFAHHQQHVNAELLYLREQGDETRRMMLEQGDETQRLLRAFFSQQGGPSYPPPPPYS